MEEVNSVDDIKKLKDNKIVISDKKNFSLENTNIVFKGKNNILYINSNKSVRIKNSIIRFNANNSVIFLNDNRHVYIVDLTVYNNSVIYFGSNNYINNKLLCIISEEKNLIIGNNCLFSFGICIRTADPHLLYDAKSHKRINPAKSVFIGDHVWIGQDVTILKGTKIGSGSVIGASSLVSKKIFSNCVYGGNPVRLLKNNIFWEGSSTHAYTKKETKKSKILNTDKFTYTKDNLSYYTEVDKHLYSMKSSELKLSYLKKELYECNDSNRFCIIPPTKIKKTKTRIKNVFRRGTRKVKNKFSSLVK